MRVPVAVDRTRYMVRHLRHKLRTRTSLIKLLCFGALRGSFYLGLGSCSYYSLKMGVNFSL